MNDKHKPRGRQRGRSTDLTTADVVVLSLLLERSMHGYDLLAEYDRQEVVDWASVSKAQVYYALRKLEEKQLISGRVEEGISRERVVFAPTGKGLAALRDALSQTSWATSRIAQPFATWLGLSIHLDDAARSKLLQARQAFLNAELVREQDSLAYIETLTSERAKMGALIVSLVIKQVEAELLWIENLLISPKTT
jgi:DNA-binding PadR family transcriptional regulator